MQASDKRYSGGSNETDLWEGSCDWSTLNVRSEFLRVEIPLYGT